MSLLQNLNLREKLIILIAILVMTFIGVDSFLWAPLQDQNIHLKQKIETANEDLLWIKDNAYRLNLVGQKKQRVKTSLVSWLDINLKKNKIDKKLKRIKPKNENEVKVWLENVDNIKFFHLLKDLSRFQVEFIEIKISKLDINGMIDVSFVVDQ